MALVRTQRATSTRYNLGTITQTTGAFTPSANSLLVIKIGFLQETVVHGLPAVAVSGGGLTYSLQVTGEAAPTADFYSHAKIYTAPVGGSPSSMTVTVDWFGGGAMCSDGASPTEHYVIGFEVEEWTGHNTSTPVGLTGSNGTTQSTSHSGTEHVSLGGTTASDSVTTAVLISDGDAGDSTNHPIGPDTGFSQAHTLTGDGSNGSDWWYFSSIYQTSPGAITTYDYASWTRNWGHADAGIEIKEAGGGGGTSITVPQGNLVLSPTAPTVAISNNVSRTPPQGNLALSPTAPSLGLGMIPAQGNLALSSVAPAVQVAPATALYYDIPILFPPIRFQLRQPFFIPATDIYTTVNLTIPQGNLALSSVGPILGYNIIVPQGNLALSSVAPYVIRSIPQGNLVISSVAVTLDFGLKPAQGNLAISSVAPSVGFGFTPAQGNLVISSVAPSIGGALNITVPQGNLVLSPTAPSLGFGLTPAQGNLALSPTAPTRAVGTSITVPQGNLALSSVGPLLGLSVVPAQGNLVLSPTAPSAGAGTTVAPPQGNLVLSPTAPTLSYAVPQGNLTLSPTAPTLDFGLRPAQGNLALSPTAPSRQQDDPTPVPQGNLALSPTAPGVRVSIMPAAGQLVISSDPPSAGGAINRTPPAGQLVISSTRPSTVPPPGQLVLSSVAPTVFATDPHPRVPAQGNLVLSSLPPQLVPGTYVYPIGGNLFITAVKPTLLTAKLRHWLRPSSESGTIVSASDLAGTVATSGDLDGEVDTEDDLEGA